MSLTADNYTNTGTKKATTKLNAELFGAPINQVLINQAIRVYLSNQRQGSRKVQSRSEVTKTTAKVWKQKGTGRARHGSRRAPIFVGGGRAHGPTGNENFSAKLTKSMRRHALKGALSLKQQEKQVVTIEAIEKMDAKTKTVENILNKINKDAKKTLIILDKPHANILKATANLENVIITQAARINTYEILNNQQIIINKPALKVLEETYLK